jgi:hypothetical protein
MKMAQFLDLEDDFQPYKMISNMKIYQPCETCFICLTLLMFPSSLILSILTMEDVSSSET